MKKIKGCLFDMDGLLIDTEKLYNRFWREAAGEYGYELKYEDVLKLRGLGPTFASRLLKDNYGEEFPFIEIRDYRRKIMQEFIDKEGVTAKSGAEELLVYLKDHGYKTSVATASPYERAKNYLDQTGLYSYFDEVTCGPEVEKGKPDPDIFLLAAKKLQLDPEECMVLEDSPNGILAAHRAGCYPVMIPDADEPDEETARILFAKEKTLSDVIGLLQRHESSFGDADGSMDTEKAQKVEKEVDFSIFVDADACPVVKIVEKVAKEYKIPVTLLCDTNHVLSSEYSEVKVIGAGADAVDFALVNLCRRGDLVVTQDYGVAAMALGKGAFPIHQSGKWYTNENIDQMLAERHLAKEARRKSAKNHLGGPKKRTKEDDAHFESQFRKLILQKTETIQ